MSVLFKKEEELLTISKGNLKQTISLADVKINNDELTIFLTDLAAHYLDDEYSYIVEPGEAIEDQRVKLLVDLIKEFVETFKSEFDNLKTHYKKQINTIKTKISE